MFNNCRASVDKRDWSFQTEGMSPERKSRFDGVPHRVTGPSPAEGVIPEERLRRELAGSLAGSKSKTKEERQRAIESRRRIYDLRPDEEVSTDAIAVVEVDPSDDGWTVRWVIAAQDGRLVVRSMSVEPITRATPPGGITANLLRELSPAQATSIAASADLTTNSFEAVMLRSARKWVTEHGPVSQSSPRAGRPRLTDDVLASISLAYLEELGAGRGVLGRLAAEFDRPVHTIRDWIRIARTREWLGPAPKQGARGGTPGPRLVEYLGQQEQTHE